MWLRGSDYFQLYNNIKKFKCSLLWYFQVHFYVQILLKTENKKPFSLGCCCFAVTPDVQITIYDSHSMWFVYILNAPHFGLWSTIYFGLVFVRTQYVYVVPQWSIDRLIDSLHKSIINILNLILDHNIWISTHWKQRFFHSKTILKNGNDTTRSKCGYCHSKEESDTCDRHFLSIEEGKKRDLALFSSEFHSHDVINCSCAMQQTVSEYVFFFIQFKNNNSKECNHNNRNFTIQSTQRIVFMLEHSNTTLQSQFSDDV